MLHKSKLGRTHHAGTALAGAGWCRLVLGLSLLLVAAACSSTPNTIGIGLPSADASTGAFLIDTLTIRTSTVLRDSVVTSNSPALIVGRYTDRQLGIITAKSYTTLGLSSGAFMPEQTQVYDSVVLVLKPNYRPATTAPVFRYGDTTRVQTLVDVRELSAFIPATQFGFASPRLTQIANKVSATSLNDTTPRAIANQRRRARPGLATLRLSLSNAFGRRLLNDGKNRLLNTQEQLDNRYPGLALLPGAADDAALVGFDATAADAAVLVYYHDPANASTPLSYSFGLLSGRHFYQVEADRQRTNLATLTTSLQQLDASRTEQQTYIQGALGLQTKLEIPYLYNLRQFGQRFVITSAVITAEIPTATNGVNLFPPATLIVRATDLLNHQGSPIPVDDANTSSTISYNPTVSNTDGITQGGYSWSVLNYCQAVLNNTIPNNGMLLNSSNPTLPERVSLGSANRTINKLRLRLYLISNN